MNEFNRTKCACSECVKCCKRQPGSLATGDAERITEHVAKKQGWSLEVALAWVKKQLWASPGALVKVAGTGEVMRVGTITPRMRKGRCVFLDEQDRCSIHEVAPFGCAYFDVHMSRESAMPRSLWLVRSQCDPEYQKLRDELPYATSYKPTAY